MEKLGIIGGLGPMATAFFLEKIVGMTEAARDQEHVNAVVYHAPAVPDRTSFILNPQAADPLPALVEAAKCLEQAGVSAIAIPCVTAHYFRESIGEAVSIPVMNAVAFSTEVLKARQICRVGIMATDGTLASGLFQKELESHGMTAVFPDAAMQKNVMSLIYDYVKAGKEPELRLYEEVSDALQAEGAEAVLLACTELSVIAARNTLPGRWLDVLDVLAMHCVERFARLKEGIADSLLHG
ncbi:MAG: amino acid racemase [Lachnospiraceae bacterium]|nr:amino acid racemase [Lachnospiraceae bacterium]